MVDYSNTILGIYKYICQEEFSTGSDTFDLFLLLPKCCMGKLNSIAKLVDINKVIEEMDNYCSTLVKSYRILGYKINIQDCLCMYCKQTGILYRC